MTIESLWSMVIQVSGLAAVAVVLVIVAGIVAVRSRPLPLALMAEGAGHGSGLLALFLVLHQMTPRLKQVFADFDVALPGATRAVVRLGDSIGRWGIACIAVLLVVVLLDVLVFYVLRKDPESGTGNWWSGVISMVLALLLVVCPLALVVPLFVLLRRLS